MLPADTNTHVKSRFTDQDRALKKFNVVKTDKHRIVYVPCPKCACTSLKRAIYQLEYGKVFEPYQRPNGSTGNIHDFYHSSQFADLALFEDYFKFTVVRDPIKRFLSAYSNRIVFHKKLSRGRIGRGNQMKLQEAGLVFEPEINYLIEHLEQYVEISQDLRHHVTPQTHFIGSDLAIFDLVCKIEDLHGLANQLSKMIQVEVNFPKLQTGGPKIGGENLTSASRAKLIDFYAADYQLLQDFYALP